MKEMLEKYAKFNPDNSIHQYPECGFIFRVKNQGPEALRGNYINTPKDMEFINLTALKFF